MTDKRPIQARIASADDAEASIDVSTSTSASATADVSASACVVAEASSADARSTGASSADASAAANGAPDLGQPYCYRYPHPAVTTDVVLFTIRDDCLQLLLIERGNEPFKGSWALPGGFVDIDEALKTCAARELAEETGVENLYLEQLGTFGEPGRDPRERVISVAYLALAPESRLSVRAGDDAAAAAWFPVKDLPPLAFDHDQIIASAHRRLIAKLDYSTIAFQLLPDTFTLSELQRVYETLVDAEIDKRNFRKWAQALEVIEDTGALRRRGSHRPARVYRLLDRERIAFLK
ncbi:NUDIX domain-containing protein [Lamprobacter modestohalophilus]|uniref:NUDIX hydrolase n=1 Tax=Lamprobacter modestohalophilus TaxID=1064514 RepID=UPI002ADEE013|nr:NUDIX domain-containing protein [Lamprobacter modestohalophilus]MEA1050550.1 NUDIX domain-containing protein [Lamprobacter modestohalophilus]